MAESRVEQQKQTPHQKYHRTWHPVAETQLGNRAPPPPHSSPSPVSGSSSSLLHPSRPHAECALSYFQSYPRKKHIQNALLSALKFVIPNNTFFSLRCEIHIGETTSKKNNTNKQKIINSCKKIVIIKVTIQKLFSSKEKEK
jgi:hypothetical protein